VRQISVASKNNSNNPENQTNKKTPLIETRFPLKPNQSKKNQTNLAFSGSILVPLRKTPNLPISSSFLSFYTQKSAREIKLLLSLSKIIIVKADIFIKNKKKMNRIVFFCRHSFFHKLLLYLHTSRFSWVS
jgi:hypothetical protein